MAPVVAVLPPALMRLFPDCEREPAVRAAAVGEQIDALNKLPTGMRDRLYEPALGRRRHINVFVASQHATLEPRVEPGEAV